MKAGLLSLILLLSVVAHARDEDSPLDDESLTVQPVVVKPKVIAEEPPKHKVVTEDTAPKSGNSTTETPSAKAKTNTTDTSTPKAKTKVATDTPLKVKTTPETSSAKSKEKTASDQSSNTKKSLTTESTKTSAAKKIPTTVEHSKKTTTIETTTVKKTAENTAVIATHSVAPANPTVIQPVPTASAIEQRQQQILINNAEKIDNMNRELLTQNQSLQLANEKLTLQVELLQHDRSSEYMRDGALAIIIGLFLGWAISGNKRRHSKWS